MEFKITQEWLDKYGIDIDLFMEALDAEGYDSDPLLDENDNPYWVFTAEDDNNDRIPDFIAHLVTIPWDTNNSHGGDLG